MLLRPQLLLFGSTFNGLEAFDNNLTYSKEELLKANSNFEHS